MRCPSCGTDNLSASGSCSKCGGPMNPLRSTARSAGQRGRDDGAAALKTDFKASTSYVDHRDIPHRLKFEYSHKLKDPTQKSLEALQSLLEYFTKPVMDSRELMKQVADTICKQFGIDNCAMGIRSPEDGKYRYIMLVGFREEAAQNQLKLEYTYDQFVQAGEFNGTMISKYTKIYLAEDNEYRDVEKLAYNRPLLLGLRRRSLNDCLEADYIDTYIVGQNEDLLGWIEYSGTRTGKLPDAATIRWIEAAAAVISAAVRCEQVRKGEGRPEDLNS